MENGKWNKKMQRWWREWIKGEKRNLYDVYKEPSYEKKSAWKIVYSRCSIVGGIGLSIISYSKHVFTAAFIAQRAEDREWEFWVVTKENEYFAVIPEEELQKINWRK